MQPEIHMSWPAMFLAVVASFAIGSVWYGKLFGKAWAREAGFPADWKPKVLDMIRGSVLNLVGTFVMVFVMAHFVQVWRPSTWNAGEDMPNIVYGLIAALFAWVGFAVPVLLNPVGYEGKSWRYFMIGAGYQLVSLLTIGTILSLWN